VRSSPTLFFYIKVGNRSPNLHRLHLIQVNLTRVPLSSLPNSLESLAITDSFLPFGWFSFSCFPGRAVLPKLKELDLSKSSKTTDSDLATIVRAWPDLTMLKLNHCYRITSECMKSETERLRRLTMLEIAGTRCDSAAFQHICRNLAPTLQHLNVAECRQFTDDCARTVVTLLTNLLSLDVSQCCQLTNSGLHSFAKMNSSLQYLNISSTKVSRHTLAQLKIFLPRCKIVHKVEVTSCSSMNSLTANL